MSDLFVICLVSDLWLHDKLNYAMCLNHLTSSSSINFTHDCVKFVMDYCWKTIGENISSCSKGNYNAKSLCRVNSGVPQGSELEPALFMLFVNNIVC